MVVGLNCIVEESGLGAEGEGEGEGEGDGREQVTYIVCCVMLTCMSEVR